jgi:hypothetical protein
VDKWWRTSLEKLGISGKGSSSGSVVKNLNAARTVVQNSDSVSNEELGLCSKERGLWYHSKEKSQAPEKQPSSYLTTRRCAGAVPSSRICNVSDGSLQTEEGERARWWWTSGRKKFGISGKGLSSCSVAKELGRCSDSGAVQGAHKCQKSNPSPSLTTRRRAVGHICHVSDGAVPTEERERTRWCDKWSQTSLES